MKKLLLILLITTALSGCNKDGFTPICETNNTGTLLVDSHQPVAYDVYIDNAYAGQVAAHAKASFTLSTGTHATHYYQSSGGGPTSSLSVTITQCQTYTAQFY